MITLGLSPARLALPRLRCFTCVLAPSLSHGVLRLSPTVVQLPDCWGNLWCDIPKTHKVKRKRTRLFPALPYLFGFGLGLDEVWTLASNAGVIATE
jgi:hypothetical protein